MDGIINVHSFTVISLKPQVSIRNYACVNHTVPTVNDPKREKSLKTLQEERKCW